MPRSIMDRRLAGSASRALKRLYGLRLSVASKRNSAGETERR